LNEKRTSSEIYNLSILERALAKTEAKLKRRIPLPLVIVIIQNGVLESILQLLVGNDIEIIVLRQRESRSVLYRKICVKKKLDGVVIMHAESKIKTKFLPITLRDKIIEGEGGIGSLIENLRIETFRQIKNIGFDKRQREIYRIYDIYIRKQLAITIKEYFPVDLPIWNSR
jgi:chorismate-pyruvate lyase